MSPSRRIVLAFVAAALVVVTAVPAVAAPAFRDRARTARPSPDVILRGSGWGHGVGMSQYGAFAMAQAGRTYSEILKYYYRGIGIGSAAAAPIRVGLSQGKTTLGVRTVTGTVPWLRCNADGCVQIKTQPEGRTWTVTLLDDGVWRIKDGSTLIFRGAAGQRLEGRFHGSVISTYNPNGSPKTYRWGKLDLRVKSRTAHTMYVVLAIPTIEQYLRGLGEVPASWGANNGMAALRAQAVTGRTYALKMHRAYAGLRPGCFCSLLATPANQAYTGYEKEAPPYGNLWVKAVTDTANRIATYNGELISTFYSSSHGGRSENIQDSWAYGTTPIPYMRSVADPWSLSSNAGNPYASWTKRVSNASFARFTGGVRSVRALKITSSTDGGTPKTLRVGGVDGSGRSVAFTRDGANSKGIVGNDLRFAYAYGSLSTLPSSQLRRIALAPFTDDDGSPNEYAVIFAASANVMDPPSSTRFAVNTEVNRATLALALYRLLQLPRATTDYYSDDEARREEGAINAVTAAGLLGGKGGRRLFSPAARVTRAEMAVALYRALQLPPAGSDRFTDDERLAAESAINRVAAARIMGGCTSTRFCPGRTVTRQQLAVYLYRGVERYR